MSSGPPGWLDNRGTLYFKKTPNQSGHRQFTDEKSLESINITHICPYAVGFSLTSRSKIPGDIIEKVAADPKTKFEMPDL